ncbi:MAG TPA: CCA tRNA nucleotidyltransferase [Planktothrix sp.]|jgi:poly(A) polymerase
MSLHRKAATEIALALQKAGYLAVFTGGCERDAVLGEMRGMHIEPKDIDIATNATPEQIAAVFPDQNAEPVGKTFGVMIINRHGINTDVATFRKDGQYGDGRRPDSVELVTTNNLEEALRMDGSRRDFTFNALYFDPATNQRYDLFGGVDDLHAGIVRAIGDPVERFMEDRLRMLRAIRFAAKYGMTLDDSLLSALKTYSSLLHPGETTKWERIGDELVKMLVTDNPGYALTLLRQNGLLKEILPELVPTWGPKGAQSADWHPEGDTWTHILMVVDANAAAKKEQGEKTSPELGLALLLHDIAKPATQTFETNTVDGVETVKIRNHGHAEVGAEMAREICVKLKRSSEFTNLVVAIVAAHMHMHDWGKPGTSRKVLFRLFMRPEVRELIAMQHADAMGTGLPLEERQRNSHRNFYLAKMEEMRNLPQKTQCLNAGALVTSDNLFAMGFRPGPIFSVVLRESFDAQIEGVFTDTESGVEWVRTNLERLETLIPPPKIRGKREKKDCC